MLFYHKIMSVTIAVGTGEGAGNCPPPPPILVTDSLLNNY